MAWHEGRGRGSSGKYSLIWPREGRHDFHDEPVPLLWLFMVRKEDGIVLLAGFCPEHGYSPSASKQRGLLKLTEYRIQLSLRSVRHSLY